MGRKSVATIERGVWLLLNKCVMYGVCHLELELNSYDKEVAAALHSDHYNINTQLRFFLLHVQVHVLQHKRRGGIYVCDQELTAAHGY